MKDYRVERTWNDGEAMCPHQMGEFDSLDAAIKFRDFNGGYIVRNSDGASYTPDGAWIAEDN